MIDGEGGRQIWQHIGRACSGKGKVGHPRSTRNRAERESGFKPEPRACSGKGGGWTLYLNGTISGTRSLAPFSKQTL